MNPDFKKLLDSCLKILSLRPRSQAEIIRHLHSKTKDPDLISQVVSKLTALHLIDDAAFGKWLIESRSRSRPRGIRLLEAELKAKGVAVDPSLASLDEKELARAALAKKLHLWVSLSQRDFQIKANRFLASRGFSWDTIASVVKSEYNRAHVIK